MSPTLLTRQEGLRPRSEFYYNSDGFHYFMAAQIQGTTFLKCVKFAEGCCGRATQDAASFQLKSPHNHKSDPHYVELVQLLRRIFHRCSTMNLDYSSFKSIVGYESAGYISWFPLISINVSAFKLMSTFICIVAVLIQRWQSAWVLWHYGISSRNWSCFVNFNFM